ncbi:hypothetical protein MYCTH_2296599 [Thermothelomyces thermophilus ATCC 42464]|uniref:PUM-HD domain-containing protein n=1 Tax=Thermothelomyces thermophilus (strain ATCC 42464 / BCRC 31852 / DSM 1799) TaxID=573729 RepID=G2Q2B5_THET4|nr:uncharacterized protein MYCTH_2296599 [Thermothelomyces thermophilus ATCC 42464]AEO54240.1 hypothetical protein MYCTH_2296599 [Thermothelomyces thermophilus ATCC 42464]
MASKHSTSAASTKRKAASGDKHSDGSNRAKKAKTATGPKHQKFDNEEEAALDSDGSGFSDSVDGGAEQADARRDRVPAKRKENGRNKGHPAERAQTSREAHARQKQLAQERKAAKPLADEVYRTKQLWEKLRRKSHVPKQERQQLVDELYGIITGRIKDFVLKHDAVRAVQTAIKYSTPTQRKQIAKELQGTYAQLAESRYAKFLIGKLLVQNDDEIRDMIIPEFYGKVRKLINHPEASWILDDIYRGVATKEQKAQMLREWYGPEFALFKAGKDAEVTADLSKILADEPSKRGPVMKYLFDMTNTLVQKKMTGFTMLHDAMLQYFLNLKPESEELKEFVEIVKEDDNGDLLKNMAFTKSGARLVCLLLAHGTAKDRKQIIKTYKDTFQLMCGDPHGHMILLAAYDVIDDTVLTSKTIFPEILGRNEEKNIENIIFLANDLNARITVCYLFEGQSKSLFPASHAYDLELLGEIHEIRKRTSKKDPEVRRKELVAAMSPPLLAAVATSPADLVATSFGCQFVADVLLSAIGDKKAALEAVASTATGDPSPTQPEDGDPLYPSPPHISLTTHGGKMFKTLIAGGRFDKAAGVVKRVDPPLNFADILYPIIKEHILQWATGPSSFTVLGLLEAPDFSSKKELLKILRSNKKTLEEAAAGETADKAETSNGKKSKSKAKGQQQDKGKSGGNQGAKLILEKL